MKIAFPGHRGAYSEAAAAALFPFDIHTQGFQSIGAAVDALLSRTVDAAVLPAEKSQSGYIFETFHRLGQERLYITHSALLKTNYVLAALRGTTDADVRRVHAHPHALNACEQFLRGHNQFQLVPHFDMDSAEAALSASKGGVDAVLCSRFVALRKGLTVLQESCNNELDAVTRYVAVAHEPRLPEASEGVPLTTVRFALEDRPGALMRKLAVFAELGLNLVRLKMFPGQLPQPAQTFLTFSGRYSDVAAGRALEVIQKDSPNARHLGTYVIQDLRNRL